MFSNQAKERARIIGQIQKCYINSEALLTPTINQVDFEKAIQKDKTNFFYEEVIKSYTDKQLKAINAEPDNEKQKEIIAKSEQELACLQKVHVVFDSMVKGLYVDVIDPATNTFKDNEINRYFNRVGKATK